MSKFDPAKGGGTIKTITIRRIDVLPCSPWAIIILREKPNSVTIQPLAPAFPELPDQPTFDQLTQAMCEIGIAVDLNISPPDVKISQGMLTWIACAAEEQVK